MRDLSLLDDFRICTPAVLELYGSYGDGRAALSSSQCRGKRGC